MQRVTFLFNHDAAHQVAHLARIANSMIIGYPEIETVIAYATDAIYEQLGRLLDAPAMSKATWRALDESGAAFRIARRFDRLFPASRMLRLRANIDLFSSSDAIVSSERTCLQIKDKLPADRRPIFIRVPHGTGDRSVTFHPDHRKFDLSLVAGPKMARQLEQHGVDPDRIRQTGYSKFETVDWDAATRLFGNANPTVVYNPHFDPHLSSWYDLGPQILEFFARPDTPFNLIFAPHVMLFRKDLHVSPEYKTARRRPDIPAAAFAAENILVDVAGPRLFDMTYTLAADAYLGDASSQIYEFLAKPRPVIIADPNAALAREGAENLPFLTTGPLVATIPDLERALSQLAADRARFRPAQDALIAHTFSETGEPPSKRAAAAIAAALEQRRSTCE